RSALRRFEYESQILARLRHPGIAQVYEAGTAVIADPRGGPSRTLPYFAMEYIPNAMPLIAYADSRNLPLFDRLALFAGVCDAVHHAHRKGLIHRDLTPTTLIIGEDATERSRNIDRPPPPAPSLQRAAPRRPGTLLPPVKIIDFGIARSTADDSAPTGV